MYTQDTAVLVCSIYLNFICLNFQWSLQGYSWLCTKA